MEVGSERAKGAFFIVSGDGDLERAFGGTTTAAERFGTSLDRQVKATGAGEQADYGQGFGHGVRGWDVRCR